MKLKYIFAELVLTRRIQVVLDEETFNALSKEQIADLAIAKAATCVDAETQWDCKEFSIEDHDYDEDPPQF